MDKSDIFQKIASTISAVLDIKTEKITENTSSQNIHNWDSLNQIKLIVSLEEEFDMEFDSEEVSLMTNVGVIRNIINKKLQQ
jgi:acyl carrier protein